MGLVGLPPALQALSPSSDGGVRLAQAEAPKTAQPDYRMGTSQKTGAGAKAKNTANGPAKPPAKATGPVSADPAAEITAVAPSQTPMPSAPVLLALLRGTLVAVNQANVTGNYSVLRDLGAPAFRESYSMAELAEQFRSWRDSQLDFAAVLLLDAKLSRAPEIEPDGSLRLTGHFPTAPLRILFDLRFQPVGGHWRLSTIALEARPGEADGAAMASAPAQAPAQGEARNAATNPPPAPRPATVQAEPAPVVPMGPSATAQATTAPPAAPPLQTAARAAPPATVPAASAATLSNQAVRPVLPPVVPSAPVATSTEASLPPPADSAPFVMRADSDLTAPLVQATDGAAPAR